MGKIGIPGMMISKINGDKLLAKGGATITIDPEPGMAEAWAWADEMAEKGRRNSK